MFRNYNSAQLKRSPKREKTENIFLPFITKNLILIWLTPSLENC